MTGHEVSADGARPNDRDLGHPQDEIMSHPEEPIVDSRTCGAVGCANAAMTAFDALHPGGSFVLVADHDPLPIHYMLDAERPACALWEPLTTGPALWQTRVRRVSVAG